MLVFDSECSDVPIRGNLKRHKQLVCYNLYQSKINVIPQGYICTGNLR